MAEDPTVKFKKSKLTRWLESAARERWRGTDAKPAERWDLLPPRTRQKYRDIVLKEQGKYDERAVHELDDVKLDDYASMFRLKKYDDIPIMKNHMKKWEALTEKERDYFRNIVLSLNGSGWLIKSVSAKRGDKNA